MQWLLEEYSSEDAISITNTATVNMTYQDGGWKIEASDEFFDALLGGMLSAVENMQSNLNKKIPSCCSMRGLIGDNRL